MSSTSGQAAAQASGTAKQAIQDAGIAVVHRELAGLAAIYYPSRLDRPHGLLALDTEEPHTLPLILAHHYLEHRSLPYYGYGPDSAAVYDSPREQREAFAWAVEFSAHCRPPLIVHYADERHWG